MGFGDIQRDEGNISLVILLQSDIRPANNTITITLFSTFFTYTESQIDAEKKKK
jgi:hypothetical protein